jgi:uncharacterized protein YacL
MNISLAFLRTFFSILSIVFMTLFMIAIMESHLIGALVGLGLGIAFSFLLFGFDTLFRRFNLRSFNIAIVGLFFGFLMGQALILIFEAILEITAISNFSPQILEIIKIALFLFGLYLGTIMTMRSSDEIYVSIPFIKFAPTAQKKRDLLVDMSVLADARIIDVSSTGLFDSQLIIPRFVIKELYATSEVSDEMTRAKSKRALEVVKKLEEMPGLDIRFNDTDFPEVRDITAKMMRLARLLDANIITADISKVQIAASEGVRIINIHTLSNALKPLMQTGETIKIKIQRYGKEPRQGVGYLDDGTMVVVNGGGDYIGETIQAQVLSVKHTTSGRMIFCNAAEEGGVSFPHHEEDDDI